MCLAEVATVCSAQRWLRPRVGYICVQPRGGYSVFSPEVAMCLAQRRLL